VSILLTIKSKQIGRKQPQNKSTDLSQTDMMNDVATSVSIHPIETLQSSSAEISSEEVVEWTRKSPFGYATQVYRVLQAAL
jgi:hypothetical protein